MHRASSCIASCTHEWRLTGSIGADGPARRVPMASAPATLPASPSASSVAALRRAYGTHSCPSARASTWSYTSIHTRQRARARARARARKKQEQEGDEEGES